MIAAHRARDRCGTRCLDTRVGGRFKLPGRTDAHVVLGDQIQRTVHANLAVDRDIPAGLPLRIALGNEHTTGSKVAPGLRLHALPLKLARRAQQHIVATLQGQRAAVGHRIAIHMQVARGRQRHAAFGHRRADDIQILARLQRHCAVGLKLCAARHGQRVTGLHIQRATRVQLLADAGIARGLQGQRVQ